MCLADLELDFINPYDLATRINKVVMLEFLSHGSICVLSLLSRHWFRLDPCNTVSSGLILVNIFMFAKYILYCSQNECSKLSKFLIGSLTVLNGAKRSPELPGVDAFVLDIHDVGSY